MKFGDLIAFTMLIVFCILIGFCLGSVPEYLRYKQEMKAYEVLKNNNILMEKKAARK